MFGEKGSSAVPLTSRSGKVLVNVSGLVYGPRSRWVADDAVHVASQGSAVLTQVVQVLVTQVYQLLRRQGDQVTG